MRKRNKIARQEKPVEKESSMKVTLRRVLFYEPVVLPPKLVEPSVTYLDVQMTNLIVNIDDDGNLVLIDPADITQHYLIDGRNIKERIFTVIREPEKGAEKKEEKADD